MDEVISISSSDESVENKQVSCKDVLSFTVIGNPNTLQRHRFSNVTRKMYNPSAKKQKDFRSLVRKNLQMDEQNVPFFKEGTYLSISLVFKMQRPKNHFSRSDPETKKLKKNAPTLYHVARKDLDNMIKFVLDSLNGLLYEDDSHIATINACKIYTNEDNNVGSTQVKLREVSDNVLEVMIDH